MTPAQSIPGPSPGPPIARRAPIGLPVALSMAIALGLIAALVPPELAAFTPPDRPARGSLAALERLDPARPVGRVVAPYDQVAGALAGIEAESGASAAGWAAFAAGLGSGSQLYFDLATGEPALVQAPPIPLLPDTGNDLTPADVAARLGQPPSAVPAIDEGVVAALAGAFLDDHAGLLTAPRSEIVLREVHRVSPVLWVVTYLHAPSGIPVAGSRLTLVIGHGNLILWGSEGILPRAAGVPRAAQLDATAAEGALAAYVGWLPGRDLWTAPAELLYLPEAAGAGALQIGATDVAGRRHRLVWELTFARAGVTGSWLAHVDAVTGEVVDFADANRYGLVRGGIEPATWTDLEANRGLGAVRMTSCGAGGPCFATIEGLFPNPAGATTASLDGRLTTISDRCGTPGFPSVPADGAHNAYFGGGPPNPLGDADCTSNGVGTGGGAHNTHAARSAYYHVSRTKDRLHSWLPGNAWVDTAHEVRVNVNDVCNAYWDPAGFNGFFREGFLGSRHCFNTGEIAAVFLHEVGHGLDQNDAQGTADGGTGETYADTLAMLELHDSCIGPGFWDRQCTGYGLPCSDCTSVRDQDYAQHLDGGVPVATPFTPANFTGPHCPSGAGPCGREVHCEAYVGGGAMWDLATRKLPAVTDPATSWYLAERTWTLGMQTATAAFTCDAMTLASDGCAATSWFKGLLVADDDNGNLTDGTPHAASIFAAFADHAIACGTAGDPSNQSNAPTCAALAAPVVAATPSAGPPTVDLSWPAVPGAGGYAVLKNHGDCAVAYQQAATLGAAATSFHDTDVIDYQGYGYRVVALGGAGAPAANACASALSNCARATVTACAGAVTAAPVLANPMPNRVQVTWNNAGGCAAFSVYRRPGTCAAGGAFTRIASPLPGPSYLDPLVSGGVTYSYEIAALDATGAFESGRSPCAEITPTGVCNETPLFDPGLTAVSAEAGGCGIDLAWSAGSTSCSGQAVVYNVYRSTTSGFTPSVANRIASAVAATHYQDAGVSFGVTYFYVVRAEALSGAGPGPNGGVEDGNLQQAAATPTGPFFTTFGDNLESGAGNWTVSSAAGTLPWVLTTTASNSPTHAWFVADTFDVNDQRLAKTTAVVVPPAGQLRFWHRFDTEAGFDGGVLEYSTNGGTTWQDILAGNGGSGGTIPADPTRFLAGGYTGTLDTCCFNPLPGRAAWTGDGGAAFSEVIVDLADFAGLSTRFRWRFGSDSSVGATGWWVDDVRVVGGQACSAGLIFSDRFESGDTTRWSATVP